VPIKHFIKKKKKDHKERNTIFDIILCKKGGSTTFIDKEFTA
jgi:hypothetical protein